MKKNSLFRNALVVFFVAFSFGSHAQEVQHQKISIINFQVVKNQNKVMIHWATNKMADTNYFTVEKSSDGKNFKTVAYVMGADPTQEECDCYGCFDKITAKSTKSYYRLKHVDKEGVIEFSEVKMLAMK